MQRIIRDYLTKTKEQPDKTLTDPAENPNSREEHHEPNLSIGYQLDLMAEIIATRLLKELSNDSDE